MKKFIILILALMMSSVAYSQMQSDSSDHVWSIVKPKMTAISIEMHECLIGQTKDSLVTKFIQNDGKWKFRVDSIYFIGADAKAFSLVSGLPKYEVPAFMPKAAEFRFKPFKIGLHSANIVIITQSDTITMTITGIGVTPTIEVRNNLIDFGIVTAGGFKDSNAVTIRNISSSDININKITNAGPNKTDFEILNYNPPYTLIAGGDLKLNLKFTANSIGRTSGSLLFDYDGQINPAEVRLFGQGIGGIIKIEDDSAFAGEKKKMRFRLMNSLAPIQSATALPFRAKIKYNPTLLTMTDSRGSKSATKEYEVCEVKGSWDMTNGNLLGEFDYTAGLGNATSTYLILDEFFWLDNSGKDINAEVEKIDGKFTLLGICHEGGTRLVNPNANIGIKKISPNPAKDKITISAKITESGTKIRLIDLAGKVIFEINCTVDNTKTQDFIIDLTNIPAGMYFIEFKSDNYSQVEKIVVEK